MAIHSRGNAVILVRPRSNLCWRTWEQPCLSSTAPCECILVRDTTISCRLLFLLWRVPSFHTCDKGSSITIRQVGIRVCMLSHVWLFATPWTIAHQAPLSMGFPRQEYLSGLPLPSPGDLPDQGSNLSLLHCRQMQEQTFHNWVWTVLTRLPQLSLHPKPFSLYDFLSLNTNMMTFFVKHRCTRSGQIARGLGTLLSHLPLNIWNGIRKLKPRFSQSNLEVSHPQTDGM